MKVTLTPRPRRGAFTLVELLVVIAIIAILVALTTAGVMKFMGKAEDVKTRNDISQLALAVQNFQTAYNVPYIPSRIRLYKDLAHYNLTNQYDADSLQFIQRVWPRARGQFYATDPQGNNHYYINWDAGLGGNPPTLQNDPNIELQGDQCLVFFLGGMQVVQNGLPATVGFSADPLDPSLLPAQSPSRKGPFYDFQSNRLGLGSTVGHTGEGGQFYVYQDGYGKNVYAYFSSYGRTNGYFRYSPTSDCQDLGVSPYAESLNPLKCLNPNSFQIISAGRDGVFGRGSLSSWTSPGNPVWSSATAGTTPATWQKGATKALPKDGQDDMSNFHNTFLGISQ